MLATSGERHVALVSANDEGGLTVHEGASRDGTAAPSFRSVRIEKKELVPESAPLLWLDESGTAHACLLVTSLADAKDDPREVHLAEVAFPKDKDSPPPRLVSVGQVKGPPRAGALARLETAGRPSQIHVVVEDRDGVLSLAHATGPDLTLKAGARGTLELPPIRPLQIAPVSGNAFILAKDPKRGPVFASVK